MGDYRATIRTVGDGAREPGAGWVVEHHLSPRAAIDVDILSGGHLLHLAVAGCLFNDILRAAPARGIAVEHLLVSADGDFDAAGSTGIRYAVEIAASGDRSAVERLVADVEAAAIIPGVLRRGVGVERAEVTVRRG
jgi:putative redox protein